MHAQDDWVVVLLGAAQAGHEDVARDRLHDILAVMNDEGFASLPRHNEAIAGAAVHQIVNFRDVSGASKSRCSGTPLFTR